jgi:hypothetical protein
MHPFSIRTLMAVILVSAIGLAALRNANGIWAGLMMQFAFRCRGRRDRCRHLAWLRTVLVDGLLGVRRRLPGVGVRTRRFNGNLA